MMRNLWWTPHLYGLIRSDVLARTGLHPAHYMGDHILLAELALYGRFAEIPEELLHMRIHARKTSNVTGPRQRLILAKPKQAYASWSMPYRLVMVYPERFWPTRRVCGVLPLRIVSASLAMSSSWQPSCDGRGLELRARSTDQGDPARRPTAALHFRYTASIVRPIRLQS